MATAATGADGESKQAPSEEKLRPPFPVEAGVPHPLGSRPDAEGVNFSVFTERGTAVQLLLFNDHDDPEPVQIIDLDPRRNKTFHFWHCYVRGLRPGYHYAYRVDGQRDLHGHGDRFNRNKVLIDPHAHGNTTSLWDRGRACGPDDNLHSSMRSAIIDLKDYDWEGDQPLRRPMRQTIIYELHVGGFTKSPTSGVSQPGTFAGVIEKIPYLQELGVTAVELLPICQFDDTEGLKTGPDGRQLRNFWGYSTISFFAPHPSYCVSPADAQHIREFRDLVKTLHQAGIEVILDVVFNHTSEGNHLGPTIHFKGLDNGIYYHLVPSDRQYYMDYSGCGNTVNCNHPIVDRMILSCLEFWVRDMHVDGFRFDEGSILARGEDGAPMVHPPVVWHIELSEDLADTKIIAEAWDAAGLYQIGYYPGERWAEWNGKYRDDIRRYVRGDPGMIGAIASRISGSSDIYQWSGHLPINSINFITAHDGFTLNDLVSYNEKHNWANSENNTDGINDNDSWNCGVEGPTDDPEVERLREKQIKNFTAIQMLSQGTPMIVGGDEHRRTQGGNNNAYCQDNEVSWFDWERAEQYKQVYRFFREMISFRKRHDILQRNDFFSGETNARGLADISWHGVQLNRPEWNNPEARTIAWTMGGEDSGEDLHVMLNAGWWDGEFELPVVQGRHWCRAIDTSLPSPDDIAEAGHEVPIPAGTYRVEQRSVVVLVSKPSGDAEPDA
jgi:isoamylase